LNAKREKFLRRADRSRIQRLTPMSSPSPLTNLAYIAYSTSFPSSISFNSFRLRALELSCPSFFNSRHLFSIACSLFSQNTGGGIPPQNIIRGIEAKKANHAGPFLTFDFQWSTADLPLTSFPTTHTKSPLASPFPATHPKNRGVGAIMVNQQALSLRMLDAGGKEDRPSLPRLAQTGCFPGNYWPGRCCESDGKTARSPRLVLEESAYRKLRTKSMAARLLRVSII
jgi:hypothetical protein